MIFHVKPSFQRFSPARRRIFSRVDFWHAFKFSGKHHSRRRLSPRPKPDYRNAVLVRGKGNDFRAEVKHCTSVNSSLANLAQIQHVPSMFALARADERAFVCEVHQVASSCSG